MHLWRFTAATLVLILVGLTAASCGSGSGNPGTGAGGEGIEGYTPPEEEGGQGEGEEPSGTPGGSGDSLEDQGTGGGDDEGGGKKPVPEEEGGDGGQPADSAGIAEGLRLADTVPDFTRQLQFQAGRFEAQRLALLQALGDVPVEL